MTLNVVDLFSGSGGMSCGFARDGRFELIAAADLQVAKPSHGVGATGCNATYERNLGLAPMSADLSKATPTDIQSHFGFSHSDVDVLCYCAPCTGFSQKQAKNHGVDDPRNGLVARASLFVDAWRPRYLAIENVKELLHGRNRHHFETLRNALSALGYYVEAQAHDLSELGLPQRRIRSLILATREGCVPPAFPSPSVRRSVRDAIGHLPAIAAGEAHPSDPMHVCPGMSDLSLARARAVPRDGGGWNDIAAHLSHLRIPSMNDPASFPDVYGRLWWDRPAPTVTRECSHPGNGRYTHPEQDRLLSVREMALIQGFPPDYQFSGSMAFRYRQIGDAVPPLVSAQIAAAIARASDVNPAYANTSKSAAA